MAGQTERVGRTWRENEYTCVKLVLTVFRAPNRKREGEREREREFHGGERWEC